MIEQPAATPRAVLYARVSNDPTGRGRSVESQLDECRLWAAREGWQLVAEVRDGDRSASRHARRRREGWEEVTRLMETGDVDLLVTWEASRAQRDLAAYTDLRSLCERTGTKWCYSGNVYDLGDRSDRFRTGLDALVAEDEAGRISERICRGVASSAMQGRPSGRRLYGYRRLYDEATGDLLGQEPDGEQSEIVVEVARRFVSGESLRTIARDLNARDISTPTGKGEWTNRQLHRMLTNPAYAAQRVHRGEVVAAADWPAVLDAELWARLQGRFADPSRHDGRKRGNMHMLTGVARCGVCGGPLRYGHDRGRRQYVCSSEGYHVARGGESLDQYVTALALERLSQPDVDLADVPTEDVLKARAEADDLRRRLEDAATEYAEGRLSVTMLGRVESQLIEQIADADRRARFAGVPTTVADLTRADDVDSTWDALSIEQRREVLRSLLVVRVNRVGRIGQKGFDPASVTIEWRR